MDTWLVKFRSKAGPTEYLPAAEVVLYAWLIWVCVLCTLKALPSNGCVDHQRNRAPYENRLNRFVSGAGESLDDVPDGALV
jgi:hypothetical protein